MSTETEKETEQITSIPVNVENKTIKEEKKKDPKKVAAGKALAKKNKEARDAFKKGGGEEKSLSFADLSNGLKYAAGTIGAGLTIYQAYKIFYPSEDDRYMIYQT